MARKRRDNKSGDGGSRWLVTYTDLCTLLMTFFVLLLSMSVIDPERKKEALGSLIGAFGLLPGGPSPMGTETGMDVREATALIQESTPLSYSLLRELAVSSDLGTDAEVLRQEDKVIMRIGDRILFEPNSTNLTPQGEKILATIGIYLKNSPVEIDICGHVDSYEMPEDPRWPRRAWKVSALRALAVYKFFLDMGMSPDRMSAYGMSYFRPVVDSTQYPHLGYKNRRVEIIIGRNAEIPTSLYRKKPSPHSYVNYKNFFFRLFPVIDTEKNDGEKKNSTAQ